VFIINYLKDSSVLSLGIDTLLAAHPRERLRAAAFLLWRRSILVGRRCFRQRKVRQIVRGALKSVERVPSVVLTTILDAGSRGATLPKLVWERFLAEVTLETLFDHGTVACKTVFDPKPSKPTNPPACGEFRRVEALDIDVPIVKNCLRRRVYATRAHGVVSFVLVAMSGSVTYAATIVDTLGTATTSTIFSVFGTGGISISAGFQEVGPAFTLSSPTVITEIGGFMNNCRMIVDFMAECPDRMPFLVDILPSVNGIPDEDAVPFVFSLRVNLTDPLTVSFVSVDTDLLLPAGSYFALFVAQGTDVGGLLSNALDGAYQAGQVELGVLDQSGPSAGVYMAAVQILGSPVPEPLPILLVAAGLAPIPLLRMAKNRLLKRLARSVR
jgi:hypothetical protein